MILTDEDIMKAISRIFTFDNNRALKWKDWFDIKRLVHKRMHAPHEKIRVNTKSLKRHLMLIPHLY